MAIFLVQSLYNKRILIENRRCQKKYYQIHSYFKFCFIGLLLLKIYYYLNDDSVLLQRIIWFFTIVSSILFYFVHDYLNTS